MTRQREFNLIYDKTPITHLINASKNLPKDRLDEMDKAIIQIEGAVGGLVRNILQALCWAFEDKSMEEMHMERIMVIIESMRFKEPEDETLQS
jgi:hypothetical protein